MSTDRQNFLCLLTGRPHHQDPLLCALISLIFSNFNRGVPLFGRMLEEVFIFYQLGGCLDLIRVKPQIIDPPLPVMISRWSPLPISLMHLCIL